MRVRSGWPNFSKIAWCHWSSSGRKKGKRRWKGDPRNRGGLPVRDITSVRYCRCVRAFSPANITDSPPPDKRWRPMTRRLFARERDDRLKQGGEKGDSSRQGGRGGIRAYHRRKKDAVRCGQCQWPCFLRPTFYHRREYPRARKRTSENAITRSG